ncbi:MAG: DNA repair protein RecN [Beggiatoa sp. IS2]|nr:MAG: DNA repair protein RecN [Beggiatoa sp. IS2]
MLQYIRIENFAIVEQLELNLDEGLTIITGETGAGKSILIDALSLVLGERADSAVVRQGCEAARVSAIFRLTPLVKTWLQQQDLDTTVEEDECLVRRVIKNNGRSRSYINDQPVSLQALRQLSEYMVDIHGQHAHQSLLKLEVQRQLLDAIAEENSLLEQVKQTYQHWKTLQTELDILGGTVQDREASLTLLRYQVQELEEFELTEDSIKNLNEEHRRLANANELLERSQQALTLLDGEHESSALICLNQAHHELLNAQEYDARLKNMSILLEETIIQAQEATRELRHYLDQLQIDPERLNWVEQRISALQGMARKHKINFFELPAYFLKLSHQLSELEHYKERAGQLEIEVGAALQHYQVAAQALHQQRVQNAPPLAEKITTNMQQLGMPGGQLTITVTTHQEMLPTTSGIDRVEFLVTANPGQPPRPLHKVVSGGELSRISLAIQVITAQNSGVATLVFDEVDVGIGGGVAEIIGQLLRRLGQKRQVLCITHLPQVACQGHHHLQVSKTTHQQNTLAHLQFLNETQRVEEVARMLGGVEITAQTLAHAREMLQRGHSNDDDPTNA